MLPTIVVIALTVAIAIALGIFYLRNRQHTPNAELLAGVRERAEQRKLDRAFMNTTPAEDPYERAYDLSAVMSTVEVDESANGYGQLSEEQKRVISAIFDGQAQVPATLTASKAGVVTGSKWAHSVCGELNQLEPLDEKYVWSNSRN